MIVDKKIESEHNPFNDVPEQCCCKCKYQLSLIQTASNKLIFKETNEPTLLYACTIPHVMDNEFLAYIQDHEHGLCEMYKGKGV